MGPDAILEFSNGKSNLEEAIKSGSKFKNVDICPLFSSKEDYSSLSRVSHILEKKYPNIKNLSTFFYQKKIIDQKCFEAAKDGKFVLTLGGDHSIAAGSICGIKRQYPDLCVLWVDAHADINSLTTSITGNLHGCPVSFLLDLDDTEAKSGSEYGTDNNIKKDIKCHSDNEIKIDKLNPKKIGYIGLRDVDTLERKMLSELKIFPQATISSVDVTRDGILNSLRKLLAVIDPSQKCPIHLSFDIDALDSLEAPATGTAVPGGLLLREGIVLCEELYKTGRLVSMDLVEVNPLLGNSPLDVKRTIFASQSLILSSLGAKHLE